MAVRTPFSTTKFFEVLLIGFIAVQVITWILSKYYDIEMLKGGYILFLFLITIALVSLWRLGKNIGALGKRDIFFILVMFLALVGLFYFLPRYIPQIFSTQSLQISEAIKSTIHSVMSEWGGTIGNA